MSIKRKVETTFDGDSENRRRSRSSAVKSKLPTSPQRKRHRASSPDAEIENSRDLQTPRSRRIHDRHVKLADVSSRAKVLEESEPDELNLQVDTPRTTRRRVILDSVEIITPRKANAVDAFDQHLLRETTSEIVQTIAQRSPTKVPPAPAKNAQRISKLKQKRLTLENEVELPKLLPVHLHQYLEMQKRAVLNALHTPSFVDYSIDDRAAEDMTEPSANAIALQQLRDLLGGSIERGEGNSCLVIGPAGSGKSKLFEEALKGYSDEYRPIVIRLNGYVQYTDRLAIREIARQVVEQTGSKAFESIGIGDDDNPFDDHEGYGIAGSLPPPSHLPSLIASLPSLPRPVVVLLDAFNIFTEQPRQALLYCLLDTVQSCRAGLLSQRGLAVVGLTPRIDVVNFLEKRVKSRFSHRILRTANISKPEGWLALLQKCLCADISASNDYDISEWRRIWQYSVNNFLADRHVKDALKDMFNISRDIRRLFRTTASMVIRLNPSSPYLTSQGLKECLEVYVKKPQVSFLMRLNYPSLALCIAAQHIRTAGHDSFTFEMLYGLFATQVRTSSAAPVMLGSGSIGMVNVGRRVLLSAFEELIQMKIFLQAAPSTASLSREFIKYRCTAERDDVKAVVDRIGQTNLKKWFNKAQ